MLNRAERRRELREATKTTYKLKKWLHSLTPEQKRLFSMTVGQEVDKITKDIEYTMDSCYAAAIDDNIDISVMDLRKIIIEGNMYMQEVNEYLNKDREGYFNMLEDEKLKEEIKAKIKGLIDKGTVKSKGLNQLKQEYKIPANVVNDLWLQVKLESGINTVNSHTPKKFKEEIKPIVTDAEKEKIITEIGLDVSEKISKLKVVSTVQKIQGQYFLYEKSSEGVKAGEKTYKDKLHVEEEKKSLESQFKASKEEVEHQLNELKEKLESINKIEKNKLEQLEEIEQVFNL